MKHITNSAPQSYKDLWGIIFPKHYQDKYTDVVSGLSGGGGHGVSYDIHIDETIMLKPHECKNSYSLEYFEVPNYVFLLVCNKSTAARSHYDAAWSTIINPGYKGNIEIELQNRSQERITFTKGQPIAQVVAVPTMFDVPAYDGRYQNQPAKSVGPILE